MLASGVPLLFGFLILAFQYASIQGLPIPGGLGWDYRLLLGTPLPRGWEMLVFLLLLVGFGVKTPLVPFHTWLPVLAMEGPASVVPYHRPQTGRLWPIALRGTPGASSGPGTALVAGRIGCPRHPLWRPGGPGANQFAPHVGVLQHQPRGSGGAGYRALQFAGDPKAPCCNWPTSRWWPAVCFC